MTYRYGLNKIDAFAYESGLLCDGTPDSFDTKAIETFAEKILSDVLNIVMDTDVRKFTYTTYDKDMAESIKLRVIHAITQEYLKQ
jgi:hypothetical protein